MTDKPKGTRNWSPTTLYKELAKFVKAHDLNTTATVGDVFAELKDSIVANEVGDQTLLNFD